MFLYLVRCSVICYSEKRHEARMLGPMMLLWLPYYCRLTWDSNYTVCIPLCIVVTQIQGHLVGSSPPNYGK